MPLVTHYRMNNSTEETVLASYSMDRLKSVDIFKSEGLTYASLQRNKSTSRGPADARSGDVSLYLSAFR